MANHIETPADWPVSVYQVGVTDPVLGGAEGPVNIMGLALAKRALYQRMRNVTPWDAGLAALHGYPAGACVRHGATTWRAKLDNNVAPGTDAAKWERWGWSEDELNTKLATLLPYAAPTACANAGPSGAADKAKLNKSALGEYWMWLGDSWRVIAGQYQNVQVSSVGLDTNYNDMTAVTNFACHRAGTVLMTVSGRSYGLVETGSFGVGLGQPGNLQMSDLSVNNTAPAWHHVSATNVVPVAAGDVQTVFYSGSGSRQYTALISRFAYID
jgi:hypothetical protein